MIYQCLVNTDSQAFIVAKRAVDVASGRRPWSAIEQAEPYEIVETADLEPSESEYTVTLSCSWGDLDVPSTRIDGRLLMPSIEEGE